jgi:hypothetical protein
MEQLCVVVESHDLIGKDTVKFVNKTKSSAVAFTYTKEEIDMLVDYGYCLLDYKVWYRDYNQYQVGNLFIGNDGKQFIITKVTLPTSLGGMTYYETHYVEDNQLVKVGLLGGNWGECIIDMAKFVAHRPDLLKATKPEEVSLFDDEELDKCSNNDCDNEEEEK